MAATVVGKKPGQKPSLSQMRKHHKGGKRWGGGLGVGGELGLERGWWLLLLKRNGGAGGRRKESDGVSRFCQKRRERRRERELLSVTVYQNWMVAGVRWFGVELGRTWAEVERAAGRRRAGWR